MNNSEIVSLVRHIAETAKRNGNDLLTIEAMGPGTLITCEKRMGVKLEPWTEELSIRFSDLEFVALDALRQDSHWDVRFTSSGIRAFGKQHTRLDEICNAPYKPRRMPMLGLPRVFQKQGVHREPAEQLKAQPEPPRDGHRWDDPD
jgi:hypothetical protein